nr:immunoglobulin light chain junction region [Macaca mulatta]MOW62023.1 immunoglobulin light chain junction region [Macaca mulatta]MOW62295.1 immunoglobulin light chain junction region [Macaca mulatta]MOW62312.1 immunoglobulin light chain junction region [Macaca mulatta]MOW63161.1 immunoglobulin light chain junction region [Macaca mulatta]
CLQDVQIPPTF